MTGRGAESSWQKVKDFVTFPLRAFTLFEDDRFGLSSLRTERFRYVAAQVRGACLDVGCGRHDRFVTEWLAGRGRGIDVFPYEGLEEENIVEDISNFPFADGTFDSVTFIANLNHVPADKRDRELAESFRCLRAGGNIVVTMGSPLAEVLVHRVVWCYDRWLGTRLDVDGQRGMAEGEAYYLTELEIRTRLARAGFCRIGRKRFGTQWGLNALYVGWKER
ncbi:MAG TPA: methyltransferase domain-containing protein [Candidatus Aminicenantes bacterium]|nr:methyltransferase domain-containing protein [Candidatus Aminicenantes bacterium]